MFFFIKQINNINIKMKRTYLNDKKTINKIMVTSIGEVFSLKSMHRVHGDAAAPAWPAASCTMCPFSLAAERACAPPPVSI